MNTGPKISVAICTYNGAKYIEQQINSILAQTYPPDELIICDDGSTDDTVQLLLHYVKEYPEIIKLFKNKENLGYAKNFEKTISLCTGDIIFLSDQDDVWMREKVEKIVKTFTEDHTIGLVYSDAQVVNENLQPLGLSIFQSRTASDFSAVRPVAEIVKNVDIKGCTFAFRSKYKPILLPVSNYWPHDHWIALILHAISKIHTINENLMLYRRHTSHGGADKYLLTSNTGLKHNINSFLKSSNHLIQEYEQYNNKVYVMVEYLKDIGTQYPEWVLSPENLKEYLKELDFIINTTVEAHKKRIQVYSVPFYKKFPLILRLLKNHTYHQYFGGYKSFCKDIIFSFLQIYPQKNNH